VLAAAGGTLGAGLACAAIAALARFGPSDVPRLRMIQVDGQVLVYTAAATLASALVFGLALDARRESAQRPRSAAPTRRQSTSERSFEKET
jgi:hypothetical protein